MRYFNKNKDPLAWNPTNGAPLAGTHVQRVMRAKAISRNKQKKKIIRPFKP